MAETSLDVELRPATLDDAASVADLDTLREPEDPRDPVLMRHWWASGDAVEKVARWIAKRGDAAVAFVSAGHRPWESGRHRYGWLRPRLHPDLWTAKRFGHLVDVGEAWLRSEGVETYVFSAHDSLRHEHDLMEQRGYTEARRARISQLDLGATREQILRTADESRRRMRGLGIELLTFGDDRDPDKARKLYQLELETEQDIPTTVPIPVLTFDQWQAREFQNPSYSEDRVWIARQGDAIVGMSQLRYPVVRGIPFTDYTATARFARGRGIARALKYQTMAQAIQLGFTLVRTQNDADNAPMLHVNEEMGYQPFVIEIEMHRDLTA